MKLCASVDGVSLGRSERGRPGEGSTGTYAVILSSTVRGRKREGVSLWAVEEGRSLHQTPRGVGRRCGASAALFLSFPPPSYGEQADLTGLTTKLSPPNQRPPRRRLTSLPQSPPSSRTNQAHRPLMEKPPAPGCPAHMSSSLIIKATLGSGPTWRVTFTNADTASPKLPRR